MAKRSLRMSRQTSTLSSLSKPNETDSKSSHKYHGEELPALPPYLMSNSIPLSPPRLPLIILDLFDHIFMDFI